MGSRLCLTCVCQQVSMLWLRARLHWNALLFALLSCATDVSASVACAQVQLENLALLTYHSDVFQMVAACFVSYYSCRRELSVACHGVEMERELWQLPLAQARRNRRTVCSTVSPRFKLGGAVHLNRSCMDTSTKPRTGGRQAEDWSFAVYFVVLENIGKSGPLLSIAAGTCQDGRCWSSFLKPTHFLPTFQLATHLVTAECSIDLKVRVVFFFSHEQKSGRRDGSRNCPMVGAVHVETGTGMRPSHWPECFWIFVCGHVFFSVRRETDQQLYEHQHLVGEVATMITMVVNGRSSSAFVRICSPFALGL